MVRLIDLKPGTSRHEWHLGGEFFEAFGNSEILGADIEVIVSDNGSSDGTAAVLARYDDPRLAIAWPLPVVHLSPRDAAFAPLDGRPEGVTA